MSAAEKGSNSPTGNISGEPMWALARMHSNCPYAAIVWLALCELAVEQGSSRVATSRNRLAEHTGIHRAPTLSRALSALEAGGWIHRIHSRKRRENGSGFATLLQVILIKATEERKTFSTLKEKKERSSSEEERKTFSIEGTKNVPLSTAIEALGKEFYRAIKNPTPTVNELRKSAQAIQELLTIGKTPEQVRTAIAYVERHYDDGTFDKPPYSSWFLKSIIDDALAEAKDLKAREEQRARLDAEEAMRIAKADKEAEALGYKPQKHQTG